MIGGLIAGGIVAKANEYNGANYLLAAILSCPVFLFGALASIVYLQGNLYRSGTGWSVFILNGVPFCYSAYLIGVAVTGKW